MLKTCIRCGAEMEGTARKRFCQECFVQRKRECAREWNKTRKPRKRKAVQEKPVQEKPVQERPANANPNDPLAGKTDAQIIREARFCGVGYGEYVSRVKMGILTPPVLSAQDEAEIWKRRVW